MEPQLRRGVLSAHLVATLLQSANMSAFALLPVLALLHFDARAWQVVLLTAAMPTFLAFSIVWGEVIRRVPVPRYLALIWLVTYVPLGLMAYVVDFPQLLALLLVCAVGAAGWSPVEGQLLQSLYPAQTRGRVMGAVNAARLSGGMVAAFLFGWLQERNPDAFRSFLPAVALLHGGGCIILAILTRRANVHRAAIDGRITAAAESRAAATGSDQDEAARRESAAGVLRRALRPLAHMRETLRADRRFYLYERAFMTYGIGWMICTALLPIFATRQLGMNYAEVANSTQVVFQFAMLLVTLPMGWVNDRLGPVRTSTLAFAALCLYPLGLIASGNVWHVGLITVWYGIAMTGVQMGWMLGPIALAGAPHRVPQYVAIHATLVGIRAVIGQALALGLYELTQSVVASFLVAVAVFALAAWQMWQLQRAMGGTAGRIVRGPVLAREQQPLQPRTARRPSPPTRAAPRLLE